MKVQNSDQGFKPFTPRPGSLTWRVINHLREHGGTLSRPRICELFDVDARGLDGAVRGAEGAEVLVRQREGKFFVWQLGPNTNVVMGDQPAPPPPPKRAPRVATAPVAAADIEDVDDGATVNPFATEKPVRLLDIPVMPDTPLAPTLREDAEARKWLGQFEVGTSAEFLLWQLPAIQRALQRHGREFGKFRIRRNHRPGYAGLERIA